MEGFKIPENLTPEQQRSFLEQLLDQIFEGFETERHEDKITIRRLAAENEALRRGIIPEESGGSAKTELLIGDLRMHPRLFVQTKAINLLKDFFCLEEFDPVDTLLLYTRKELATCRGLGKTTLDGLERALETHGLYLPIAPPHERRAVYQIIQVYRSTTFMDEIGELYQRLSHGGVRTDHDLSCKTLREVAEMLIRYSRKSVDDFIADEACKMRAILAGYGFTFKEEEE